MAGYGVASLVFSRMSHHFHPFKLMGAGLMLWCAAITLSGMSGWIGSYGLMVAARVLSGVGEASFQIIGMPFIDDYAPPEKKGLWISIFLSAIPVGTALGYVWAGVSGCIGGSCPSLDLPSLHTLGYTTSTQMTPVVFK